MVVVVVVLQCAARHQSVRLPEDGHLRPPRGPLAGAGARGRGLPSSLGGLGDPRDRRRGQLGVDPLGRRRGVVGPRGAELRPPVCGAGDGVGGAVQVSTPIAQADLGALETKAGNASAGRAVNLLRGHLNGHLGAAGRGRVGVTAR